MTKFEKENVFFLNKYVLRFYLYIFFLEQNICKRILKKQHEKQKEGGKKRAEHCPGEMANFRTEKKEYGQSQNS